MRPSFEQTIACLRERRGLAILLSCTLFPLLDATLCLVFSFSPFFMDSIFTALAASLFGPLPGLVTAAFVAVYTELFHGFPGRNIPFAICGMATALIVWAFSREKRLWPPFAIGLCILAVSAANTILGALITIFVFGGGTGARIDTLASGFALLTGSDFLAALLARIPVNTLDKSIAVIPALLLASPLDRDQRRPASTASRKRARGPGTPSLE